MIRRWIVYLAALGGCLAFYWAYREWFSWFALVGVLCLPWLSLLLSLPAMWRTGLSAMCPAAVAMGEPAAVGLSGACRLPEPPLRGRLLARHAITGQQIKLKRGMLLPTGHCGQWTVEPVRAWVFDYLGLFRMPVRQKTSCKLLVRPKPVALADPPDLSRYWRNVWKPKAGGGFAENHELRLYRPGDNLRQIHWKLSAKTGKLILREPMEPIRGRAVLSLELNGTPEQIDEKLGLLAWLSSYLLQQGIPHEICCLTGQGMQTRFVDTQADTQDAVDALLQAPCAKEGAAVPSVSAAWQYHIGGGSYGG